MAQTRGSECALSVVIPVRDGAEVIGRCLQALSESDTAGEDFEVIVADNGSKDHSPEVVRAFATKLNLRILSVPGVPVSAVRNAGAAHARGALLAFVDADCIVGTGWMRAGITYPWGERSGAIGSFFAAGANAAWVARVWSRFEGSAKFGAVGFLPAGNMIVRRAAFEAAGGFDETLVSNEDAEFCWRLQHMGLRIEAVPQLEAVHLGAPETIRALYCREVWHGRDVLLVFRRSGANGRAVAFALYVLLWGVASVAALAWWLWTGDYRYITVPVGATIASASAIGLRWALRTGEWRDLGPLVLLLVVYGVARAEALVGALSRAWHRRVRLRGDRWPISKT